MGCSGGAFPERNKGDGSRWVLKLVELKLQSTHSKYQLKYLLVVGFQNSEKKPEKDVA